MADLLEALLQIKALAETAKRLEGLLGRHEVGLWTGRSVPGTWTPAEVVAHLADAELFLGVRLRQILTLDRPLLQTFDQDALARRANYADWPPLLALSRFRTRREETLELLSGASAADLSRLGRHPSRGELTVADLVALTLAHDTDHLGQIRERLEHAESVRGRAC